MCFWCFFFRDKNFIQGISGELLPTRNYTSFLLNRNQASPPCSSFLTGFGVTALLDAGTGGQDYKFEFSCSCHPLGVTSWPNVCRPTWAGDKKDVKSMLDFTSPSTVSDQLWPIRLTQTPARTLVIKTLKWTLKQAARAASFHSILVQRFTLTYRHNGIFLEAPASITFPRGRCTSCRGTCLRLVTVKMLNINKRGREGAQAKRKAKKDWMQEIQQRPRNLPWLSSFPEKSPWFVEKSRPFGPIQPESWSGQPEACWSNKKSLLWSTKNFPYDFTETSGFWRFGMASWKSHCCDIPPSLPTFKRRIRRRAKRVLTSKSFLQRAERRCVEA